MNRQELKGKIRSSRGELESALGRISNEQRTLVILHGEWSIKDLIGHLGFWEARVVSLFLILKAGGIPESDHQDMDILNAENLLRTRGQSLEEVVGFEQAAYKKVLELIDTASDKELTDPHHFAWTQGRSFDEMISDNTWGHYEEHLPEVMAWLKRIA